MQFLANQTGLYRVYNQTPGFRTEPNRLLPFRLASVGGYSSLETERYDQYMSEMLRGDKRFLDLWNVKYIIAPADQTQGDNYKVAYRDSSTVVYQNDSYLPRAFLVESAIAAPPGRSSLNRMEEKGFNPAKTVVIEEPFNRASLLRYLQFGMYRSQRNSLGKAHGSIELVSDSRPRQTSNVEILDYQREQITIRAAAARDSFLVLADSYYPGWRAYVDGAETRIYRADYLFRAVHVPAGSHTVKFVFEPNSFEIGRDISIATLLAVVAALGYGLFRIRTSASN